MTENRFARKLRSEILSMETVACEPQRALCWAVFAEPANPVHVPEGIRTPDPPRQPTIRAISLIRQLPPGLHLQNAIREMR
jgi:hypothetical protein